MATSLKTLTSSWQTLDWQPFSQLTRTETTLPGENAAHRGTSLQSKARGGSTVPVQTYSLLAASASSMQTRVDTSSKIRTRLRIGEEEKEEENRAKKKEEVEERENNDRWRLEELAEKAFWNPTDARAELTRRQEKNLDDSLDDLLEDD